MKDTIWFVCPACGTELVLESEAGSREIKSYHINEAPIAMAADVAEGGPYTCERCAAAWKIDLMWITSVMRVVSDPAAPAMRAIPPAPPPSSTPIQESTEAAIQSLIQPPLDARLLTAEEAASFLRVAARTLSSWRRKGVGPRYFKLGKKRIRYDMESLLDWLDHNI